MSDLAAIVKETVPGYHRLITPMTQVRTSDAIELTAANFPGYCPNLNPNGMHDREPGNYTMLKGNMDCIWMNSNHPVTEGVFWEIFYEHCSYFSLGSLARLFQYCGFDLLDIRRAYGDQYLMSEAKPCDKRKNGALELKNDIEELKCSVKYFNEYYQKKLNYWHYQIKQKKRSVVLWDSYSKSAAFLSTYHKGKF